MWYHITKKFLGKTVKLEPRVPTGVQIYAYEGNIPRICVSGDIYSCIKGKIGKEEISSLDLKNFFKVNPSLYYTEEEAFLPPATADFRNNDEHWILKPTDFYFLGYIDLRTLLIRNRIVPTDKEEVVYPRKEKLVRYRPRVEFIKRLL